MGQAAALTDRELRRPDLPTGSTTFEKLQELTRHGYVPDTQPVANGDGILLRHRSAPDLILWSDGRVDVPLGQSTKGIAAPVPAEKKKRRWGRAFLIFSFLAIYTFFSFLLIIALTE